MKIDWFAQHDTYMYDVIHHILHYIAFSITFTTIDCVAITAIDCTAYLQIENLSVNPL